MRQYLLIVLIIFSHLGCNLEHERSNVSNDTFSKQKKHFEYDAIEHYSQDIDDLAIDQLYSNQEKTGIDSIKFGIILGNLPERISDFNLEPILAEAGYKKVILQESTFGLIDKIFTEQMAAEDFETACVPIYRDILIFKLKGKVVGLVKICFECLSSQIVGPVTEPTNNMHLSSFIKLKRLLHQ